MTTPTPLPSIAPDLRVLRPRRAAPADAIRPTRAEVNLAALLYNLRVVKRHAGNAKVWAVLKADGYGHGAPAVARTLERAGASGFCVALLEEAVELREAGIRAPILVMGGYYGGAHEEVIARGLVPVVYDIAQIEGFARIVKAGRATNPVDVHLKIDTGMSRLGVTLAELPRLASVLHDFPEVRIRGLMTHLSCADTSREETTAQMIRFDEATAMLAKYGVRPEVRHAANTAALFHGDGKLDAVRPGIAMFGYTSEHGTQPLARSAGGEGAPELKPVMRVRSEIIDVRDVPEGTSVGYGALWKAPRASRIATIPMGYADGLSRALTNKGHVLVRGKRAPIVGAISMDLTMIDVTGIDGADLRDEVVVLGPQEGPLGKDVIGAGEMAAHAGTIAWEVLTSISRRVPRFYREP